MRGRRGPATVWLEWCRIADERSAVIRHEDGTLPPRTTCRPVAERERFAAREG